MSSNWKYLPLILIACSATMLFAQTSSKQVKLHGYFTVKPAHITPGAAATRNGLPLWGYDITSTRDGNNYDGVMVGSTPFNGGDATTRVTTQIVPLIVRVHRVGTSVNGSGIIHTEVGDVTFDPTVPNTACLAPPNDVPLKLVQQSPIVKSAPFSFGAPLWATLNTPTHFSAPIFGTTLAPITTSN